ncbi:hypothetical protein JMUB4039_0007 [Leptotrichia trevisanii]|uniref:tetratricopeptide repeat protein n=1 Tax=Leptotrichia trevisanii TaxID=109328 RepID=UPI001187C15B|nr:tetratricopeptide repeat protein [Leptotrichia trevisanii]BBM56058.1 hypothetical protein JMUB4039_0007 [Leptotrichia trevisanii]
MYIEELLKEADKSMENYKYDDALVYLKSVLEIDENNYSALMTLSKLYSDFGMFEQAKEYAEKLQKKYPDSRDTLFTLGFVYQSLGRLKKAISLYKKFLEIEKNYFVYLNMGMSYALLKYYRKAIENIDKAIEMEPESSEAYVEKGDCLTMMGKYDEAICEYTRLLNAKFNEVEEFSLYARMGDTMAYSNNIKGVVKYYNIAINCDNVEDYIFEDYFEILFRAEEFEEIKLLLLNYENATYENKGLSRIKMLNLQGRFFVKIEDYENAQKVCNKMIILEPENSHHYVNLAYVLELQNKYDEALEYVDKMDKFVEDKAFLKELKKRLRKNKRKFEKENEKSLENKEK